MYRDTLSADDYARNGGRYLRPMPRYGYLPDTITPLRLVITRVRAIRSLPAGENLPAADRFSSWTEWQTLLAGVQDEPVTPAALPTTVPGRNFVPGDRQDNPVYLLLAEMLPDPRQAPAAADLITLLLIGLVGVVISLGVGQRVHPVGFGIAGVAVTFLLGFAYIAFGLAIWYVIVGIITATVIPGYLIWVKIKRGAA